MPKPLSLLDFGHIIDDLEWLEPPARLYLRSIVDDVCAVPRPERTRRMQTLALSARRWWKR